MSGIRPGQLGISFFNDRKSISSIKPVTAAGGSAQTSKLHTI